jgi:hypothetical protein
MPRSFASTGGSLVVDDRYFPLILSRWSGEITMEVIQQHIAFLTGMLDRARAEGLLVAEVSDGREAERPPATMRKLLAERVEDLFGRYPEMLRPTHVVIDNPVLRGVLTAMSWLTRQPLEIRAYRTLPEAIRAGLAQLHESARGTPPAIDPDAYAFPDLTVARVAGG